MNPTLVDPSILDDSGIFIPPAEPREPLPGGAAAEPLIDPPPAVEPAAPSSSSGPGPPEYQPFQDAGFRVEGTIPNSIVVDDAQSGRTRTRPTGAVKHSVIYYSHDFTNACYTDPIGYRPDRF